MKRNRMPEVDDREPEIVNDQYNDDDTSYLPVFDEGVDNLDTEGDADL